MTSPLGAARAVTKLPARDLDRVVADLRARRLQLATLDMGDRPVTDQIVTVADNYPSKGTGERGAFFHDSEGDLIGLGQPTR